MTAESNPEVLNILYNAHIINSNQWLTSQEAAQITSFPANLFKDKTIRHFDESVYFTGITSLPEKCFQSCTVTSGRLSLPPNVRSVGDFTLGSLTLTSLTMPASLTTILAGGLAYCNITNLIFNAVTPPTLGGSALGGTTVTNVYVPKGCVSAYRTRLNLSSANYIELE